MDERAGLEAAIAALEAQRDVLGDAVVEAGLAPMREKLAALQAAAGDEQRKLLTVLFADVSGFTALAESHDAEDVGALMNGLWARLDAVLQAHGGRIDKHIGDAVMALFGAPTAREDDPERAIRAALALQDALAAEAVALAAGDAAHPPLQMRVGISTGPVLLGAVGTVGEVTALGDTVNLASRLEHAAPVGGILIAHDTYRHVRGLFDVEALPPLDVRGKAEPVRAYRVKRAKPRGFHLSARGVAGVETPLVGRDLELRRLREAFEEALEEGAARAVTVVGDTGVGKSRLLAEFEGWLDLQSEQVWYFKGRARQETQALPYALIRDLLAYRFGIGETDSAAAARTTLETGVRALLGEGAGRVPASETAPEMVAPLLGQLMGLDFATHPALHGLLADPRALRERAFAAASDFWTALARARPVVILLEDLHWADDGSLDLLARVTRAAEAVPLLMVGVTRPGLYDRRPNWGEGQERHSRLVLEPLSTRDTRRLAQALLARLPEIPPTLLELVMGQAEGNPFYVEEMVQMLVDDGVLVPGPDRWTLRRERLAQVRVPPTLAGVLQARLDGLPSAERGTLQRAAVVGRVFWEELVAYLDDDSGSGDGDEGADSERTNEAATGAARAIGAEATGARLSLLRRKELVYRREESSVAGTAEYLFKHSLLRDVAYESVLRRKRRTYHSLVAAWLEVRAGERAGELAGLIAEHYAQSDAAVQAGRWFVRAGDRARATDAPDVARAAYERALALLPRDDGSGRGPLGARIEAYAGLGDVLERQAHFGEAQAAYEQMRALAAQVGDPGAEARAWLGMALAQEDMGDLAAALTSAERSGAVARAAGLDLERTRALYRQGKTLIQQGQLQDALARGEQALAVAEALQARAEIAASLDLVGGSLARLGRFEDAERVHTRVLALARELGDRRLIARIVGNLGFGAGDRGDWSAALPRYAEALAVAREIGDQRLALVHLINAGEARAHLGEAQAAETDLRQAIALATEAGATGLLSHATCYLAVALLAQGRVRAAQEAAQQALALGQEIGESYVVGVAWRLLGQTARCAAPDARTGVDASGCFTASLQALRTVGMSGEVARTLRAWAEDAWCRGERARAAELWTEARETFIRLGMAQEAAAMADLPGDSDLA